MLVTNYELNMMNADMHEALTGLGSSEIEIEYRTLVPGSEKHTDLVYKNRVSNLMENPIVVKTFGMIQVVKETDLAILQFGVLKVGDAIFYFVKDLDMNCPNVHFPVFEGSLVFIDSVRIRWKPVANRTEELSRLCAVVVGGITITQAIPCYLERDPRNAKPVASA